MICLMSSQVRLRVAGSCAIAFQKLLIQSVLRVDMMSSYTARTSGEASLYSIRPRVDMRAPTNSFRFRSFRFQNILVHGKHADQGSRKLTCYYLENFLLGQLPAEQR